MLVNKNASSSWNEFFNHDILEKLKEIEASIGDDYTPSIDNVFKFMNSDLNKIKICIIGQDPYFSMDKEELVANGRAFQPNNLIDWSQKYRQVSLKNMLRLIHKTYLGISDYDNIKKYNEVLIDIQNGSFNIRKPKEWFESMENQGVLFLNRYLTTKIGEANAHRKIWDEFMIKVFKYIDNKKPDMIWFLWGKEAMKCSDFLNNGCLYISRHPMMCSNKYDDDFLKAKCFKETMNIVNWLG